MQKCIALPWKIRLIQVYDFLALSLASLWKAKKTYRSMKNVQVKTRAENVRFLSWRIFFVGKYGIQSTNEMAFEKTVTSISRYLIWCAHSIWLYCHLADSRMRMQNALLFRGSEALTTRQQTIFTHAHAKCRRKETNTFRWNLQADSALILLSSYVSAGVWLVNVGPPDYFFPETERDWLERLT